ncbi:hypothetical protein FRC09_009745, partial [Ceratobasidium sp. 395]
MSSARRQSQPSATTLKPTHLPVQRLILSPMSSPRAPSPVSAEESATEPRRSTRTRRPSSHKLESDAYQADSQEPSRAPTPSAPKSKSKSKSGKSKKKKPWGEPGARPGRITQPASDPEPSSDEGSPGPLAKAGSNSGRSRLADQRLTRDSPDAIDQEEAVCRASVALGSDASRLSAKTIKQVLAAVKDYGEDADAGTMEVEGESAPALPQSTGRVVLGGGCQPPAEGAADNATTFGSSAPAGQRLVAPINSSATEPNSDPEFVELGPEDSVSQRIDPQVHQPLLYPQPTPVPRLSPKPALKLNPTIDESDKSDTNTDTVDTDDDLPIVRPLKRQHPTLPFRGPLPPRPVSLHPHQSAASSTGPAVASTSRRSHAASMRPSAPALPQPPPIADLNAVLAWAAQLAKQTATNQGAHVTNEYGVLARVLDDLRLSQLAAPNPLKRRRDESDAEQAAVLEAEAAFTLGAN